MSTETISWDDFMKVDLRVGTIVEAREFPQARKPAYILTVDFGKDIGCRTSSARITDLYSREELAGRKVIAVVNLTPRQIGPVRSECLVTGFYNEDGAVVLAVPDGAIANGARLA